MRNFLLLLIFISIYSCISQKNAKQKPITRSPKNIVGDYGILDSNTVKAVKTLLQKASSITSYDTLLIRYDFDDEKCWTYWDTQPDDLLLDYLSHRYLTDDSISQVRKKLGYFRYREPGKKVSKFVTLNKNVRVDSTFWLRKNIILKQGRCGTSIMIFPDYSFLRIYDDPHDDLLFATPEKLTEIIQTMQNIATKKSN